MPIGSAAIYLVIAGLALAQGPARGNGWWRRIAFLAVAGLLLSVVVRGGIETEAVLREPPAFDLLALLAALLIAADLIGLPLPVARRLGLGLRSREWEFDRRLFALTSDARRAVQGPPLDTTLPQRELSAIIARIAALSAPDEDWASVRDGWALAWQQYLDLLPEPRESPAWAETLALQRRLIEQTEQLRARYRSDASRILGERS